MLYETQADLGEVATHTCMQPVLSPCTVRQDASLALIRLVESGDMREWLITQEACAVPILLRTIQDCDTDSRMCRGVIKVLSICTEAAQSHSCVSGAG